jgi:hypothetical protein
MIEGNQLHQNASLGPGRTRNFYVPSQDGDVRLFVHPILGSDISANTWNYALHVSAASLAEQSVLQKTIQWTDQDPIYKRRNAPYKDFPIKLKGGRLYVIDLRKSGTGPSPVLFLENAGGNVVANGLHEFIGGKEMNSRIIFAPPQDGDYRIIATSAAKTTGESTLTVRQTE